MGSACETSQAVGAPTDGGGASRLVVGIADMKVTADTTTVLLTYSLGSCIGVTVYDPQAKIGGLIHCMLPTAKQNPDRGQSHPFMFVDTGVSAMLAQMLAMGADKSRLIVKVAGGAAPLDSCGRFRIGERNVAILRKLLWKNDLMISADDVGGTKPRTMSLYLADGVTTIKAGGPEAPL